MGSDEHGSFKTDHAGLRTPEISILEICRHHLAEFDFPALLALLAVNRDAYDTPDKVILPAAPSLHLHPNATADDLTLTVHDPAFQYFASGRGESNGAPTAVSGAST
jgi:hypothetical protein